MKYEIVISWSEDDELFIATVPDLPGCMSHGTTYESALADIQEAMALWLEVSEEFGDPIPQPRQRALSA
jgi:predicted RNase H-like HicB family nuclease